MAKRTRSEIVAFAAGGVIVAAFLAAGAWFIASPNRENESDVVASIVFSAPAGSRLEAVEAQITRRIEHSVQAVDGIEFTASLTRSEGGVIIVKFKPNIGEASNLRTRLAQALSSLPLASSVKPIQPDSGMIAYFGLFSDRQTHDVLTDFAERYVKVRLQEGVGVAEIRIHGALRAENRVRLDQNRLTAYGLSLQAIETVLRQHRIETRAEPAEGGIVEFAVSTRHELQQLEQLVVGQRDGAPLYLRDVAAIRRDVRGDGTIARFSGRRGVVVEVIMRPDANILEVTRAVRDRFATIVPSLPAGVDHAIGYFCSRCALARER